MNSPNIFESDTRELSRLLKNWATRQSAPEDGRERLLRVAEGGGVKQKSRLKMMLELFTRPYWLGRPEMSYAELSRWLFNQSMMQMLQANQPEWRLVC